MPCLWIGSGALHCSIPSRIVQSPPFVFAVMALLVCGMAGGVAWCVVFTVYCLRTIRVVACFSVVCGGGSAYLVLFCRIVLWVVEWRCVRVRSRHSSFVFLFFHHPLDSSSSSFCVGVRGSARAAMRARTLSPNTIASLLLFVFPLFSFLFSFLCFPLFFIVRFSIVWNGGGGFTMCRCARLA